MTKKKYITLMEMQKSWDKLMPDCGVTLRKSLYDSHYGLNWISVFNEKRMQRRYLPKVKIKGCLFCNAAKSEAYKLASIDNMNIYGNIYPVEKMHLLLFNDSHKEDPSIDELISMMKLANQIPDIKILVSNRLGSGASFPSHFHVHAFTSNLPIEHAIYKHSKKVGKFEIGDLNYPAWTIKINYKDTTTIARLINGIIKKYPLPFNIDFIGNSVYIIPRKVEQSVICEDLVDGVGSLETAGIYSITTEAGLKQVNLKTFTQGLAESSQFDNRQFQDDFLYYCIEQLKS